MTEQLWAPYAQRMQEQLMQFQLQWYTAWEEGESFGNTAHGEKIAKAGFVVIADADRLCFGVCTLFPAHGYDLPIFLSRWEEYRNEIILLVDLIPTVDILVDEPYRKKYIEPLDPLWQRYESLAGICPEEHDGLRSVLSIIYTAARVPIEREGMRIAALAPHLEYLKQYCEFYQAAVPVNDSQKLQEIQRRTLVVHQMLQQFLSERSELFGPHAQRMVTTVT